MRKLRVIANWRWLCSGTPHRLPSHARYYNPRFNRFGEDLATWGFELRDTLCWEIESA